jgi:hypothetical protein
MSNRTPFKRTRAKMSCPKCGELMKTMGTKRAVCTRHVVAFQMTFAPNVRVPR